MASGLELKLKRVAADVKVKDLAAAMEVTGSYITRVESRRLVSDDAEAKYTAALIKCTTNSTTPAEAA